MEEHNETKRTFTSWKLSMLDAMSCDTRLSPTEYRVGFRLMQHLNDRTREAHPSMERIASQIGCSIDTVKRSLKKLEKLCWIKRNRRSRNEPYFYRFREDCLNMVLDGKLIREEEAQENARCRKKVRFDRANLHRPKNLDSAKLPLPTVQICPLNTLVGTT